MEKQNEEETLNFDQPTYRFTPKEFHDWRQQGPWLVCRSCDLTHSIHVGVDKILVGLDKKGKPIIKKRQIV